jgi:tetratricopeptide (TPR) repeat protein
VLGDDHPRVAETLNELGTLLYFSGHSAASEPFFREAIERYRHLLGNDHPEVASILNNLGRVLLEQDKLAEAEPLLREALATDTKLKDPGHDDFVFTMNNLALARLGLGQVDAAFELLQQARTIATASKHRMLGQVWTNIADVYLRTGRVAEALAAIATARPLLASDTRGEVWFEANAASIEGAAYVAQGDLAKAKPLLLESYSVIAAKWGERGFFTRMAAERTATLYDARGDSQRAAELRAGRGAAR